MGRDPSERVDEAEEEDEEEDDDVEAVSSESVLDVFWSRFSLSSSLLEVHVAALGERRR